MSIDDRQETASSGILLSGATAVGPLVRAVIDAVDEPCIVVDGTHEVRWFNRDAALRFPALSEGFPLSFGVRVTTLYDAVDSARDRLAAEIVEWHDKVPTERWSRAHVAPLIVPGIAPFLMIRIEDLTETRRMERMRADFVANASHELRTPLAALSGFIETLQGPARDDGAARARFLGVMAEQAARMKRLIDDLLSLSRIEMKAHLRPEAEVDLCEVLARVLDLARPAAGTEGITLALEGCDTARAVRGDREELVQVFTNLVENAVKYGGAGGSVEVTVRTEGDLVLATVRDHGDGIDPVHLPRLTERFYRGHSDGAGSRRGTGLGLAIVKHIVTRHGGRLDIWSRRGEGSAFTVALDRWKS